MKNLNSRMVDRANVVVGSGSGIIVEHMFVMNAIITEGYADVIVDGQLLVTTVNVNLKRWEKP